MATLATKYRPKTFEDVTEQSTVVEILSNMCKDNELSCRNFLLIGSAGCGKAQPLYSNVITTAGYKLMEDIKPGDITFTSEGKPAKITGVFDQGKLPVYKIYLDDGSSIVVAESHINIVALKQASGEYARYEWETRDLIDNFDNINEIYIPAVYPISPKISENIDTYLLAVLRLYATFDKSDYNRVIFNNLNRIPNYDEMLNNFKYRSIPFKYIDDNSIECNAKDFNISKLKYIVEDLMEYSYRFKVTMKVSALNTRASLFKNLLSFIGYEQLKHNKIKIKLPYSNSNDVFFVNEFIQLTESLGYIIKFIYTDVNDKSLIYEIQLNSTFDSEFNACLYRKIEKIEYRGSEYCRCLWVDDDDHTYLTDHFIPTHNTTLARIMGNTLNDNKGEIIEIDAASNGSTEAVRNIVQQAQAYPVGQKWKVFILDECFTGDTKVSTPKGNIDIKDVKPGDVVYNLLGQTIVKKVYKARVDKDRLCCVKTNDSIIYTTKDHLFLTPSGWVSACNLENNENIYCKDDIKVVFKSPKPFESTPDIDIFADSENKELKFKSTPHFIDDKSIDKGRWQSKDEYEYVHTNLKSSKHVHEVLLDIPSSDIDSNFGRCKDNSNFVWMYDLEIAGHPSYFANDTLVHNCHSFSNSAWQVLLKVLEEQPARTIFFFATTNAEKIPATILSRVQTFQISKISLQGIESRLKYVIDQENKEGRNIIYTEDAINFLAKLACGGMRDALTLLDKALAYSKDLTSENLEKALNLPSYDDYFELLSAYAKKDNTRIIKVINSAYNSGVNFVNWLENFHAFVMNIVKFIFLKDITATMIPVQYAEKISKYNEKQALVCMKLSQKLVELNQEVRFTNFQQELALTYLCFPVSGKGDTKS